MTVYGTVGVNGRLRGSSVMGCLFSRGEDNGEAEPLAKPKYVWEQREQRDPALFTVRDQVGVVVGRIPGQLNGTQFIIDNCRDCGIFVFDHTKTVTVDDCTDCRIFLGPCSGSVFFRDCRNCVVVVAAQQFRVRDCMRCSFYICSASQPVMESSSGLKFGCFQANYPQLRAQFSSTSLSVFNNQWSDVHDFTKGLDESNWTLLPPHPSPLTPPTEGDLDGVDVSFASEESIVPYSMGTGQQPDGKESCLVVFFPQEGSHDRAVEALSTLKAKATLVFSQELAMKQHEAEAVFAGNEALIAKATQGVSVLLNVSGNGCINSCKSVLTDSAHSVYFSPTPAQGAKDSQAFANFHQMKLTMQ